MLERMIARVTHESSSTKRGGSMRIRHSRAAAVPIALALGCASTMAATPVTRTFTMPAHLQLSADSTQCSNSPGPQITFSGELALAGLGVDLIFRNNAKGTHTFDA